MKKLIAMLLALAMLLCCAAVAESNEAENKIEVEQIEAGSVETKKDSFISSDKFAALAPIENMPKFEKKSGNMAPSTTDTVSVSGDSVIIKTAEGVMLVANVPANYNYIVQDLNAMPILTIMQFGEHAEEIIQWMIDNSVHFIFMNELNNDWYDVRVWGGDAVSNMVGNLSTLSQERVTEYATAFATAQGCAFTDIVNSGKYTWMRFNDSIFVTVAGGQYVVVVWEGDDGDVFDDDTLQDALEVLDSLTLFN
jgi:hypothetical protein